MNKRLGLLLKPNSGIYLLALLGFGVAAGIFGQYALAAVELLITLALLVVHLLYKKNARRELQKFVHDSVNAANLPAEAELPFPTVLVRLSDNAIMYGNDGFIRLTGLRDTFVRHNLGEFLPKFSTDWLLSGKTEYPYDVTIGNRRYRVHGVAVQGEDTHRTLLGVLYFADLTELYQVRDEYIRSRPVVAIAMVDNYEELTRNMSDGAISALDARLNNTIQKWTKTYHGLQRRLEKNRFLLVFEKRDLKHAINSKFPILEDIHQITGTSGLPASISLGVGVDGATFAESYEFAALSIEMALSRGGDQAVVKDRLNFNFYGGRAQETGQRSKVRSRVMANSMLELIGSSSQVFIMGHRNADLDAVGAAMGIACLCRKKDKPAYIVLDMEENAAKKLIDEIRLSPAYKDVFISGQEALLLCDDRSTLVVVDTNRPDQVEFKPLLESAPRVCVVDHHRRAADYIKPVVVNFHEPYASSASELVAEMLQYGVEREEVLPIEAKSLLAGIVLDTKSFHVRTGERTFEAAAYLRQLGADTVEVKKLLQNDFQNTIAKYQIIKSARLYRQEIAIAALSTTAPRALAAQAADELLNISGITASFVLYPDEDQVVISARSIGDANVQVILEPLGGGGNAATAGAQIRNSTVKDVLDSLVESIDRYYEN
ncbi:MAG: DHH family phosphoesterase [Oscillospiraceae bacterium]|nr:DHH family phosphoesterase [Oscillospiraceae bacterium]